MRRGRVRNLRVQSNDLLELLFVSRDVSSFFFSTLLASCSFREEKSNKRIEDKINR